MPRRRLTPDYDLILGSLPLADRLFIASVCDRVGIPPEAWPAIPGLATIATALAMLGLAGDGDPRRSATNRLRDAAEILELEDDCDQATDPSAGVGRLLRNWRARGKTFRASKRPDSYLEP
ncbi:MAG: hypothetical protein ACKVZ0_00115 [Gemmatimonadales bacterium]